MGSREICACTFFRISVIARWAATPSTCDKLKEVIACTMVAPPAAKAIFQSRSVRPRPITTSIRYLVEAGKTSPMAWFTIIKTAPSSRRRRWAQTSSRASAHAFDQRIFFFGAAIRSYLRYTRRECFALVHRTLTASRKKEVHEFPALEYQL